MTVLTKDDYDGLPLADRRQARAWFCGLRQVIETVNGWLDDTLGLKFPRARTPWGLLTRLAAKVAAYNLALYLNHLYGRPTFARFSPFATDA